MASVTKINGKYRALVRRKGHKHISKWFEKAAPAWAWAKDIEAKIAAGTIISRKTAETVSKLVNRYREMRAKTRPILDTSNEHYVLRMLERTLGPLVAAALTVDDLMGWALQRRDSGAGPYTINMDLSKLSTVFRYAGTGVPDVIGNARPKLSYMRLIGGGGLRERRPSDDESARVLEWLAKEKGQSYADFAMFAAITAMRRGEVAALRWVDIDHKKKMASVLRKHPRKGKVLEVVPLLGESWAVIQRQPKHDERVFPIHPQTMTKYFTQCCRELGIPDLHLHDLRHEGISAMFEAGWDIPHVAVVSGHKDWRHLKRYTQIDPASLHDFTPQERHVPGTPRSIPPGARKRTSASRPPRTS